jgi:hypothetical protein
VFNVRHGLLRRHLESVVYGSSYLIKPFGAIGHRPDDTGGLVQCANSTCILSDYENLTRNIPPGDPFISYRILSDGHGFMVLS